MFCPSCRDEFRRGFTRCASCDVDLVESLDSPAAAPRKDPAPAPARQAARLLDFCGFVELDEARRARDQLRTAGIACEIAIREDPASLPEGPIREEHWLRVDYTRFAEVSSIVGFDAAEDEEHSGGAPCPSCGNLVPHEESFCPGCGARSPA